MTWQQSLLTLLALFVPPVLSGVALWGCNELYYRAFGRHKQSWMIITGLVGTPVHEMSHAATATLFGMKVNHIAYYHPDPASNTLGFVNYSYNPGSVLHRFGMVLVGLAPLVAGAYIVFTLFVLNDLPTLHAYTSLSEWSEGVPWPGVWQWTTNLVGSATGVGAVLVLLASVMIGTHSTPSVADMKGTARGLIGGIVAVVGIGVGFHMFPAYAPAALDVVADALEHFSLALIQLCLLAAGVSAILASAVAARGVVVALLHRPGREEP